MEKWKHLDEQQQVYAAVITDGDNDVGSILDVLKETGVENNTIVLFSSDDGPESTGKRKAPANDKTVNTQGYDTYYSVGQTGGLRGRKGNGEATAPNPTGGRVWPCATATGSSS